MAQKKPKRRPGRSSQVKEGPELIIGLVGAIGTDLDMVSSSLEQELLNVEYTSERIHLSKLLPEGHTRHANDQYEDKRIAALMTQGNEFRQRQKSGDALARLAIGAIREIREIENHDSNAPIGRHAYILRSLKHPDEEARLRDIYGEAFVLIAAYAPRHLRLESLTRKIAQSHNDSNYDAYRDKAEHLIQRDASEENNSLGQDLRGTFPRADVFLNTADQLSFDVALKRFVQLLFQYPFHTPLRDEYSMFIAQAASLRSADLSRQVGAAITNDDGAIIAVGTNEVPKAGGGLYWANDSPDHRDFLWKFASSESLRKSLLADILQRLQGKNWFTKAKSKLTIETLCSDAMASMQDAQFMNLIEFQRAVHAEMAALLDAAKRGVSVKDCTLYSTTFPCHDCAKHIVAAGIRKVVYIYPYPKSRAGELYPDSISLDGLVKATQADASSGPVVFEPFVGISPRRYLDLFTMTKRKKEGRPIKWHGNNMRPKGVDIIPVSYLTKEMKYLKEAR